MKYRNQSKSIDASSIADIAFLLLAFIIISTTLEKEKGVPAVLPQQTSHPVSTPIQDRNILEIFINKDNLIQIEDEYQKSLLDIQVATKEFMSNVTLADDLPKMDKITISLCKEKIAELENQDYYSNQEMVKWKYRLEATQLLGSFYTVNKAAVVSIKYDKFTSYGSYLEIRDYILRGLNELRNELCQDKFGITYSKLESIRIEVKTDEQIAMQRAVRQVYPQRIIKLEAIEK